MKDYEEPAPVSLNNLSNATREKRARAAKNTASGQLHETKLGERVIRSPKPISSPKARSIDKNPKKEVATTIDPNDPYALIRIDQNENDANVICDICLDSDDEEGDEIVICEMCLVGVHQTCYGGSLRHGVPHGDFYCERCTEIRQKKT
jgi:hypothetical protein